MNKSLAEQLAEARVVLGFKNNSTNNVQDNEKNNKALNKKNNEKKQFPKKIKTKKKVRKKAKKKVVKEEKTISTKYTYNTKNASEKRIENALSRARGIPRNKEHKEKIILESKRGTRIDNQTLCDGCAMITTVWSYRESNYGRVNLCAKCKVYVFDNSFGSLDALDYAETGGRFEGNRSKH